MTPSVISDKPARTDQRGGVLRLIKGLRFPLLNLNMLQALFRIVSLKPC